MVDNRTETNIKNIEEYNELAYKIPLTQNEEANKIKIRTLSMRFILIDNTPWMLNNSYLLKIKKIIEIIRGTVPNKKNIFL